MASRRRVEPAFVGTVLDGSIKRYVVKKVKSVRGPTLLGLAAGWHVTRVESRGAIGAYPCDLAFDGAVQHLAYTGAATRAGGVLVIAIGPATPQPGNTSAAPLWVRFMASRKRVEPAFVGTVLDGSIRRYLVNKVNSERGPTVPGLASGWHVTRVESRGAIAPYPCDLAFNGVVQHLAYTPAATRRVLAGVSATETPPAAVMIAIKKSAAWWSLAQDERQRYFQKTSASEGHTAIGRDFADRIYRRLYTSRYQPGSPWDFLTYFEFSREHTKDFAALLARLRKPKVNPEWSFVEREFEVWMTQE